MELAETILNEPKTELHNAGLDDLYEKLFPTVAQWVSRMGGRLDDAKDLFQDALIILLEIKSQEGRKINQSEEAYILGIAKHLWLRKYQSSRSMVSLNQFEKEIAIPTDFYPTVSNKRLLRLLEIAGQKCLDLLRAFYYQKKPVNKLARELGYANEHSASVQKYKCLQKLRHTVKEKSLDYEDFYE